jgi:hypothetical protein
VIIDEARLHDAIETLAASPAPPTSIDAPEAIARGRRIVKRRRIARATTGIAAGGTAAVLAVAVLPTHGAPAHGGTVQRSATATSALPRPSGPGTDPLTLSGTFGWLPANAANAGYSLHDNQIQAVARGSVGTPPGTSDTPMIWLTIYPKGTTPPLGKFADGSTQLRLSAPDVNGHTAYWMTDSLSDPTNGGDTYLRWQSADGQWGEVQGYSLATPNVTTELLRIAAGVNFAPNSVPLPLWISGLPSSTVTVEADLDRPSLTGPEPWDLALILMVGGATVQIAVAPTDTATASAGASANSAAPQSVCKIEGGLTACVIVTGSSGLPSTLSGGAAAILTHVNLLGADPSNWTTAVIQD